MKNAIILHGTDGDPASNWFPWLKKKLESKGYNVWAPSLPQNHTPNRKVYNDFIFSQGPDLTDAVIVGHSSGAVSVLNLLMDERCPKVKLAVVVSAWKGGVPLRYEPGNTQFDNLFPTEGFNFELIKQKADKIEFLHSDDDPYCRLEQAEYLASCLNAPITIIHKGHHLGSIYKEFPKLWEVIKPVLKQE